MPIVISIKCSSGIKGKKDNSQIGNNIFKKSNVYDIIFYLF